MKKDWRPVLLVLALALAALPLVGSLPTWVTLTVAGLAMGMMIFLMACGLTLVFGLMDVLNFAHGIFISVGAYGAATVLTRMGARMQGGTLAGVLSVMLPAVAAAIVLAKALELPEHQGVTLVETWGTSRPPWWRALLVELGFVERPEPAGLGMVFVPFAVDPTEAFRDRLYYTMGDSDLF